MFNFTTTTVINSNVDLSSKKPLWTLGGPNQDDSNILMIKRLHAFNAKNVTAIYKAEPIEPQVAKACIDFSDIEDVKKGDKLRLNIYIGLTQASQDSRYANDMIYKGKPFSVEFTWKDDKTAESLEKIIRNNEIFTYGEKMLNAVFSGNSLALEAVDEYQRFRNIEIEKFDRTITSQYGGEFVPMISFEDFDKVEDGDEVLDMSSTTPSIGSGNKYFEGKEGFGTYEFILHNLRIPTTSRTDVFALNQEENPIPGATYTQYTIHYCADRGQLGLNAVGDTVRSVTTHVLFVLNSLVEEFDTLLNDFAANTPVGEVEVVEIEKKSEDSNKGDEEDNDSDDNTI